MSESELIRLVIRLLYWSVATARRTKDARKRTKNLPKAIDIGDPVRDAVTAAFAQLLPEPLRDMLELDQHQLPEIDEDLTMNQHGRLLDELVNRPCLGLNTYPADTPRFGEPGHQP